MRNVDTKIEPGSKETRCRLWCSIFILEQFLTTITGRPTSLDKAFAVNAPLLFAESHFTDLSGSPIYNLERKKFLNWTLFENASQTFTRSEMLKSVKPSPSLYFFYQIDLFLIANDITSCLYSVHALRDGWTPVERSIKSYSEKLDNWVLTINDELSFADGNGKLVRPVLSRSQVSLALNFYNTCILLNRPCLSRPGLKERAGIRFPRNRFENDSASTCVRSALLLINVLPDNASEDWFYGTSPWWAMLHFLMQATTVLLIYLAVRPVPVRAAQGSVECDEAALPDAVLSSCKKALHWLHHMAKKDLACRRAFELCHSLFCRIASSKDINHDGVPSPSLRSPDHPDMNRLYNFPCSHPFSATSAAPYLNSTREEGMDSGATTTPTVSDFAIGNRWNELLPLSFMEETDIAFFLSVADADEKSTVHNTDSY